MRVGVDLIEIPRIARALERYPGFRERCFTEAERAYCDSKPNPPQHYAARFAGKEAVGKALGSGVRFTWREIEIAGRPKPGVTLTGKTKAWAERVRAGDDRALDDALEGARPGGVCRLRCLEAPLQTEALCRRNALGGAWTASSVAPVASGYEHSLRPCHAPPITPRRRSFNLK